MLMECKFISSKELSKELSKKTKKRKFICHKVNILQTYFSLIISYD